MEQVELSKSLKTKKLQATRIYLTSEGAKNIMQKYDRIFVIVMDSLGVGPMADSPEYGDLDVNTLGHISEAVDGLDIPNMQKLGVANLIPLKGVPAVENPLGYSMKMSRKTRHHLSKHLINSHSMTYSCRQASAFCFPKMMLISMLNT